MKVHLKKLIEKTGKKGSYVTEAAIVMPVLILSVCAMLLIIKIAAVCEGIWFAEVEEMRNAGLDTYKKITNVSLCKKIEEKVLSSEKSLTDFKVEECKSLHERNGIKDLISINSKADFNVVNPIGIDGKITLNTKIISRAFTGTLRDSSPLPEADFKERGEAEEVWVFPRYGIRFHVKECRYMKIYDKKGSCKLVMDKKEAEMKGFTPCLECGGAANA